MDTSICAVEIPILEFPEQELVQISILAQTGSIASTTTCSKRGIS